MTDNRTYTRYDADSDVDAHQMTHFDPYAELAARTQQLAEAMTLVAELSAENDRLTEALAEANAQAEIYRQDRDTQRRIWLYDIERLRTELDAATRRADDAVAAYHVIAARMGGMGWWC